MFVWFQVLRYTMKIETTVHSVIYVEMDLSVHAAYGTCWRLGIRALNVEGLASDTAGVDSLGSLTCLQFSGLQLKLKGAMVVRAYGPTVCFRELNFVL